MYFQIYWTISLPLLIMFSFVKPTSPAKKGNLVISDYENEVENDENCNSNINISKRSKLAKRASTSGSIPNLPKEVEELIKQLQNELQIKESVISNLGLKVERLEDEIKNNSAKDGVLKRQHPSMYYVLHYVPHIYSLSH